MDTILGIDLGTTNSVVSILRDGKPDVLREDGEAIVSSVVGLDTGGKLLVGAAARNQWVLAPDRTVRSIKRMMGEDTTVRMGDQDYSPQEISAMILRWLKDRAERQLGHPVSKAVITVPAFFKEKEREATREAGELAGLEVERIINEPTAASLNYRPESDAMERLVVYDLGGGTFDVSIVQIEQGVIEVLASHGDTKLGGDDFDQLLLDHVCAAFEKEHGVSLQDSLSTKSRVLRAVESAKIRLSAEPFVTIEEEFITEKNGMPLHLKVEVGRQDYEDLIESLLSKTLVCLDEALSDAKLNAQQIDKVILVGGASRTPMVHRLLEERLGRPIHGEVDPDLCVAMGAALQGGLIQGTDIGSVLVDITPHTLGIEAFGYVSGIPSPTHFSPIIHRNTALPASQTEVYTTHHDGQKVARIAVYQGEHEDLRHDEQIGDFRLEGLAEVQRGNKILVRFDLDLDGILKVRATERETGLEEQVLIDNAISRFREDHHDEAKSRVDAAFGDPSDKEAVPPTDEPAVGDSEESAVARELQSAIAEAEEMIARGEQIATHANSEDEDEIRQIIETLRSAITHESLAEIEQSLDKLEDLVFYLQDT